MLFDSHCHLHDKKFNEDREAVIERAREAGVTRILSLGDNLGASRKAIELADAVPEVLAAAGIHPSAANSWDEEAGPELEQLLEHPRVVVLGEIGLDYYWEKDERTVQTQQKAFREQLRLARRLGYSVSIHTRDSNADILRILQEEKGEEIGGVLHSFVGDYEEMRVGLDMGFYIGAGGISTFKNSHALREALQKVGPDHLLLETDSPYLAPQAKRGRRNEPSYVAYTADSAAEFLGIPREKLEEKTFENTIKAFRIPRELAVK